MKTPSYLIQIPEPCHQDWDAMQPEAKGRFCGSCSKVVIDFSNKSDSEIRDILISKSKEKVCGHFKKSQVDRPLQIPVNMNHLPKQVNASRSFAIAAILVFGTFLFSCTDLQGQKIQKIEFTSIQENYTTMGEPVYIPLELTREVEKDSTKTIPVCTPNIMGAIAVLPEDSIPIPVIDTTLKIEPMIMGKMMYVRHDTDEVERIKTPINNNITPDDNNLDTEIPNTFLIYPNPGSGEFTIRYENNKRSNVSINVFDVNGSFIQSLVSVDSQYEGHYEIPVNLINVSNGSYEVVMIKDGKRSNQRIIIQR